jgi:hypothetical protein
MAGATFKSVDWFVPPYMQGGVIRTLAADIEAVSNGQKHAVLEAGLRRLYGPAHLAAMLLERYRKVELVRDFAIQIREAMEASAFGLDHAAVAALLPVLEGVLRRLALADGRNVGSGTKKLVDEIEQLAERERRALAQSQGNAMPGMSDALVERIEMLEQLRDFTRDRLLFPTAQYDGHNFLNRHGILHGIFGAYGVEANFQKLISFLDGLVFFISLGTSGISCLAPDDTAESQQARALPSKTLRSSPVPADLLVRGRFDRRRRAHGSSDTHGRKSAGKSFLSIRLTMHLRTGSHF